FFSSRRRHTRFSRDWSSDVCSSDLVDWQVVGQAFEQKPFWKKDGGIWAPDINLVNGKYHLYYAYSTWGDPNPGIGVAVADQPTEIGRASCRERVRRSRCTEDV